MTISVHVVLEFSLTHSESYKHVKLSFPPRDFLSDVLTNSYAKVLASELHSLDHLSDSYEAKLHPEAETFPTS